MAVQLYSGTYASPHGCVARDVHMTKGTGRTGMSADMLLVERVLSGVKVQDEVSIVGRDGTRSPHLRRVLSHWLGLPRHDVASRPQLCCMWPVLVPPMQ